MVWEIIMLRYFNRFYSNLGTVDKWHSSLLTDYIVELQFVEIMRLIAGLLHHEQYQDSLWLPQKNLMLATITASVLTVKFCLRLRQIFLLSEEGAKISMCIPIINCSKDVWDFTTNKIGKSSDFCPSF